MSNVDLIDEARLHAFSVGPNMGICASDGESPLKDVLRAECDLVQRLADVLEAADATALNAAAKELEDEGDAQDNADMLVEWEYKAAAWLRERAKQ